MRDLLRLLGAETRRQWGLFTVATCSTIFVVLADLARPFPLKLVVDEMLSDQTVISGLAGGELGALAAIGGLVLCISGVEALASYQMEISLQQAGENFTHTLRVSVYAQLQRLSLSFHEDRHHGDLLTRATSDVAALGRLLSESLGVVVSSALLLVGMVIVSVFLDPVLALVTVAVAPLLALLTFRFRHKVREAARRQRAKDAEIASLAAETLSAMREVKALGSERFEFERLRRKSRERQQAGLEASRMESRFAGFADVLAAAGAATVLVVGALRVAEGALSAGDLIVMISYARRIHRPLRDFAKQAARVSRAIAQAERISEIMTTDRMLTEPPDPFRGPRARGGLELDSVRFSYTADRPVLDDLSLSIPAGQRVALVGPSGAGKSTVAALLARFYDPTAGSIRLDGVDLRDCSLTWLRDQIGLVLQQTILFTGTVTENIAYGVEAGQEEVIRAARTAGAHTFICQLPDGYETLLGPRGVALSGGERQRIAIARTLLRDPPVLLLDEPTTALDAQSQADVLAGLETLIEGRTVLMISHSPSLARWADRILTLQGGRVVRDEPSDGNVRLPAPPSVTVPAAPAHGIPTPDDRALPNMAQLLTPEVIAAALQRMLEADTPTPEVELRRLRYIPGRDLVVRYRVKLGDDTHDVTGTIAARNYLERRANDEESLALAAAVDGRSPAARPLYYHPELGCLFQWYPLDLALPALAERPAELLRRLQAAGVRFTAEPEEPTLLAYRPRKRAVCRFERHVVKFYAKEARFRAAALGLQASMSIQAIGSPRFEAALREQRLTVQSLLPGSTPEDAFGLAGPAGEALAALHRSAAGGAVGLRRVMPEQQLGSAAASARVVGALVPSLVPRLDRMLQGLEGLTPAAGRVVISHGDFSVHNLMPVGDVLALLDFDELRLAPPALDLATYLAYLVRGRAGDLPVAALALEGLLEGYGPRPEGVPWYVATTLLRRAPRPFRAAQVDWPERIVGMVAAAEDSLDL